MTTQLFMDASQRARTVQMPSAHAYMESEGRDAGVRGAVRTAHDEECLDECADAEDAERDAAPQRPEDRDSIFEGRERCFVRPRDTNECRRHSRSGADDQTCEHAREAA